MSLIASCFLNIGRKFIKDKNLIFVFFWLLQSKQLPGHMVRQRVLESRHIKWRPLCKSLHDLIKYIEVECTNVFHQKALPALEDEWDWQEDILVFLLEYPLRTVKILDTVSRYLVEMANKYCICHKRYRDPEMEMYKWNITQKTIMPHGIDAGHPGECQ